MSSSGYAEHSPLHNRNYRRRLPGGCHLHRRPLFTSAAAIFGRRLVGVVLSGRSKDGATGLKKIKDHGGLALVHDPEEAAVPQMPAAAVATTNAEVLRIDRLARRVAEFCGGKTQKTAIDARGG
jgi:chemotaxis response regulator CheB